MPQHLKRCRNMAMRTRREVVPIGVEESGERFLDPPRRVNCASRLLRGSEGGGKSVGLLRSWLRQAGPPEAGRRNDRDVLCDDNESERSAHPLKRRKG